MDTLKQLKAFCDKAIADNPEYIEEITDLYFLAVDEINDGGSESHECQLAYNDIIEYLND